MIFSSKYKRRIEIAKLRATIKIREIEKEKALYKEFKQTFEWCGCIMRAGYLQEKIDLLDALLKGKDIQF